MHLTTTCFSKHACAAALVAVCTVLCSSALLAQPQVTYAVIPGGLAVPSTGVSIPIANHAGGLQFSFQAIGDLSNLLSGTPAEQVLGNQVLQGFQEAGHLWSNIFNDPITVNVDIDYPALGTGILGQASSPSVGVFYGGASGVRSRLIQDATSADDAMAVANLQPGSNLDFLTNDTSIAAAPRVRDNTDNSGNNRSIDVNRANAKAIGALSGNDSATDVTISFSSNFSWDFNRGNGITGGQFDFVGVAAHEIGHALGFVSGVDSVDFFTTATGAGGVLDLDPFRVFSVLDLYRYSNDSLTQAGQPANGAVLDLAFGEIPGDTPYFSIDAGTTASGTFSTGFFNGDGRQASHFEDFLGLGIMDPTFAPGQLGVITGLDVLALDVIGYDLIVPEPSSLLLFAIGFCAIGSRRRV